MAWWWPESRVETRCHLINLYANCVLVVTENFYRYSDCYTSVDVPYKEYKVSILNAKGTYDFCQNSFGLLKSLLCFWSGTSIYTFAVYWIIGGMYTIMDVTNKPAVLRRYKIQAGTNEPVETKRLMKASNECLFLRHIYIISGEMPTEIFVCGIANFCFPIYFLPSFSNFCICQPYCHKSPCLPSRSCH